MSVDGPGTTTADPRPAGGVLDRLRAAARIAVVIGAAGSLALMFRAGRRQESIVLIALFAIWVLAPFVGLALADLRSKRWSVLTRATLYSVTLVLALGSLGIYGAHALWPPRAQAAFIFIVVPPATWLLSAISVALAGMRSRRVSHRREHY